MLVFEYRESSLPEGTTVDDLIKAIDPVSILSPTLDGTSLGISATSIFFPYIHFIRNVCRAFETIPSGAFEIIRNIFVIGKSSQVFLFVIFPDSKVPLANSLSFFFSFFVSLSFSSQKKSILVPHGTHVCCLFMN